MIKNKPLSQFFRLLARFINRTLVRLSGTPPGLSKPLVFALLLFAFGNSYSQSNYPVTVSPILVPPQSLRWSTFYSSTDFFKVALRLKDNTKTNVSVFLRFKLERVGVVIESRPDYVPVAPMANLSFGIPVVLTGPEMLDMFRPENLQVQGIPKEFLSQGGRLPDGFYTLTVTAYEYDALHGHRQISNVGFTLLTVFKGLPPKITYPSEGQRIPEMGVQNILFQWLPRTTATLGGIGGLTYELELFELNANDDPNVVIKGKKQPITGTEPLRTNLTSYSYGQGFGHTALEVGHRYSLRIRVVDPSGNNTYENEGYSEVVSFYYGSPCESPQNLMINSSTTTAYNIKWDAVAGANQYEVAYRPQATTKGSLPWESVTTYFPRATLKRFRANDGLLYEFRVRSSCSQGRLSDWSETLVEYPVRVDSKAKKGNLPGVQLDSATPPVTLDDVLNPFDIVVSTGGQTDEDIATYYEDNLRAIKATTDKCGAAIINAVDCEPVSYTYEGTEAFSFAPNKLMYLNGYEILITSGDATKGEGLLYYPYIAGRLAVQWSDLEVVEGDDGTYGCVTKGEAIVQGSDGTVLQDDLNRQILALLNQGPGSFTGKFGEALDKIKTLSAELRTNPPADVTKLKEKQKELLGALKAIQKGFNEWKQGFSTHFGSSYSTSLDQQLTRINAIQSQFSTAQTCLESLTSPTSGGGGGNFYLDLSKINQQVCQPNYVSLENSKQQTEQISQTLEEQEEKRKKTFVCNDYKLKAVDNNALAVTFGEIHLVFPEAIEVLNDFELKVISTGKVYHPTFDAQSCYFFGFYDKSYMVPKEQLVNLDCGTVENDLVIYKETDKTVDYTTDLCSKGYYERNKIKTFGNIINNFAQNLTGNKLDALTSLFSGSSADYASRQQSKHRLFITDVNTSAEDVAAIRAYVEACSDCIWVDYLNGNWELKELGYFAESSETMGIIKSKMNLLLSKYKDSFSDVVFTALYKGLAQLENDITENIHVPDRFWNCDDAANYALYTWLTDDPTTQNALAAVGSFLPNGPLNSIAFAAGILDGIPAVISGVPGAFKLIAGAGSTAAWNDANTLFTKLSDYRNAKNNRRGVIGALTDGLANEFDPAQPCKLSHNLGVLTTGIAVSVATAGYGAIAEAETWFQKGMWILKKLDDLGDVFSASGLLLKGLRISPTIKIHFTIGDGGKLLWQKLGVGENIDWSKWQTKLANQEIRGEGKFDVILPEGEALPANAQLVSIVKDADGNWVRDADGYGIGCVQNAGWELSYEPSGLPILQNRQADVLYASTQNSPFVANRTYTFTAASGDGCPNGASPVVVKVAGNLELWFSKMGISKPFKVANGSNGKALLGNGVPDNVIDAKEIVLSDKIGGIMNERIVHPPYRDYPSIDAVTESGVPLSYKQLTTQNRNNITSNINNAYKSISDNNIKARNGQIWKDNIKFEEWVGVDLHVEYPFPDVDRVWLEQTLWPAFARNPQRVFKNDGLIKQVYIHIQDGSVIPMDMNLLTF